MTRDIRPGHVAFYLTNVDPARPSAIRRAQRNAGNRHVCIFCGKPQLNVEAVIIHQKVCEYRDDDRRAVLRQQMLRRRRWERRFDALYDIGYAVIMWARRAVPAFRRNNVCTRPLRGPEPTYPTRTQRLLDSVAVKYGRPHNDSGWKTQSH